MKMWTECTSLWNCLVQFAITSGLKQLQLFYFLTKRYYKCKLTVSKNCQAQGRGQSKDQGSSTAHRATRDQNWFVPSSYPYTTSFSEVRILVKFQVHVKSMSKKSINLRLNQSFELDTKQCCLFFLLLRLYYKTGYIHGKDQEKSSFSLFSKLYWWKQFWWSVWVHPEEIYHAQ